MLSVECNAITASPSGIHLGVTVRYGENGPVRFARVDVPVELITTDVMDDFAALFVRLVNTYLDAERDTAAHMQDPLF